MDKFAFILVLMSIFTHAYWNYLIKCSKNKHIFTALSKLMEAGIFGIPAVYYIATTHFHLHFLLLILVAATITFLNYFFLASAYKYGDLSLMYPISRSSTIYLPIFAYLFIDEKIDGIGAISIILILLGTLVMHLDSFKKKDISVIFSKLNNRGTKYAFLAAMAAAGYTLWDKISVTKMRPFLYFYLYTFVVACLYNFYTYIKFSKSEIKSEWNINKSRIIQVGFFNSFTYLLILTALTTSKASYVGGLRQLSIVFSAFLGFKLLEEKFNTPKKVGIIISITGASLMYLAK